MDTFGNDFGLFWNFEKFLIFLKIFEESTLRGTLGKKNFRNNYPETCSKHVWTFLGTYLGIFAILKIFDFFENFRRIDPHGTLDKTKFSKKLTQNMFKTRLDTFGNDFGHFCNFEKFLIFLKISEEATLRGTLGKKNFRNNYPETCSKHVWTFLGTYLGIFAILKICDFFENFRRIDPHGTLDKTKFSKKLTQNMFKTRLDTFGNDFGHFCNFEKFLIFLKISEDSTLHGKLSKKNFSKKLTQNMFKTRLDTFGNEFGHFCNLEKFLIFFENFRRIDPPWITEQKKFSKKLTQNLFKTRLDTFGNDFGHFCNFEKFLIFLKISEDSNLHGKLSKKNFSKKLTQNMFKTRLDTFGNVFGHFCNFEKFFFFFENFRRIDPHGTMGKTKFSKKLTQNMFKTRLDTFGNDSGLFWNFEVFLIFLKIFEDSTLHGTLGKKNFSK